MNIAFSTILVILFLLPGLIFRKTYFIEQFSKQYYKNNLFEFFIGSLAPALALHGASILIVSWFGYSVNIEVIGELMMSSEYPERAIGNIQSNQLNIFGYHCLVFTFAGLFGWVSNKIVRSELSWLKLDRKLKIFRFQNTWHYLLKGEFADFNRADFNLEKDDVEDIEYTLVDALVSIGKKDIIYAGVLVDYELNSEGKLDTITLRATQRRNLDDDFILVNESEEIEEVDKTEETEVEDQESNNKASNSTTGQSYYTIPGHVVVIPYREIKNINLTFMRVELTWDSNFNILLRHRMVE